MKKEELKKLCQILWKNVDKLRETLDASEYKDIILPIFFLKYINDIFESKRKNLDVLFKDDAIAYSKDGLLFLPKESRWKYLLEKSSSSGFKDVLSNALTALSNVKENKEKIENVFPENYFIKNKYNADILKKILLLFENEVQIEEGDEDAYGNIYEYFLKQFALESGKKSAEFYTPESLVDLLVNLLKPTSGKIYDPCFGSGGMFIHALNYIKEKNSAQDLKNTMFIGQEKNYTTWRLCKMNMIFHNMSSQFLGAKAACTFLNNLHTEYDHKMDYILANPPFNLKDYWDEKISNDSRWKFGTPPKGNANYAWIQHMISKLASNGKAAFIMSLGALTSTNSTKIRQKLIEANIIDAILVLPDKLFYSTGIGCSVWIINKNKINKNILMATFGDDFGVMQKQNRELNQENIQYASNLYQQHLQGKLVNKANHHHSATPEEIIAKDFSLLPNEYIEYVEEPIDWDLFKKNALKWEEINQDIDNNRKKVKEILEDLLKNTKK